MHKSLLTLILAAIAGASSLSAASIGFSGTFNFDDDVVIFHYRIDNTGPVTVSTTSFVLGGFAPILTLFSSDGTLQFYDAPLTPNDASLTYNSVGGEDYVIALSQYDNYALGPNRADGFTYDGLGNFTAEPPFNNFVPGGQFLLPGGEQRTGNWAVTFTSADPTLEASVPEPSTGMLAGAGLLLALRFLSRKNKLKLKLHSN